MLIIVLFFTFITFSQVAPVNPPTGGFEIDGNLLSSANGDWINGGGAGGFVIEEVEVDGVNVWKAVDETSTGFVRDDFNSQADLSFTGGSSFGDNPNDWSWSSGKPTSKCDINTVLLHQTTNVEDTQKWLILAGDRLTTNGTSYIDFEFSQGKFARNSDGTFTSVGLEDDGETEIDLSSSNGRTPGDFVLSMEYSNGGTNANVHYYVWEGEEGNPNSYKFVEYPITDIAGSAYGATNGDSGVSVPFEAFDSSTYIPFAFVEAAVNIDGIIESTGNNCTAINIKTVFVKTKASDSYNAALKDFVDPIPVNFQFGEAQLDYLDEYCNLGTAPPTVSPSSSGMFSATPDGLVWAVSNPLIPGEIDLAASTPGDYTITFTPTGGVCLNPIEVPVTINALPSILELMGSSICSEDMNTGTISSTNYETGVSYQLYDSGDVAVGSPLDSDDAVEGVLTWTGLAAGNGYYVKGTGASPTLCESESLPANVIEVTNPVALVLTGSSICSEDINTGTISSTNYETGVSYQLYDSGDVAVGSPLDSDDAVEGVLTWTGLAAGNGYYVKGTGASPTLCESESLPVNVIEVTNPVVLVLTGSSICSANPNTGTISSTNYETGVSYQLYDSGDVALGSPLDSDDAVEGVLTWTGLATGNGYYVKGTGASPTICDSESLPANVIEVTNPVVLVLTGSSICSEDINTGTISSTNYETGVSYQLYDSGDVAVGSPLDSDDAVEGVLTWTGLAAGNGYYVKGSVASSAFCESASLPANVTEITNPVALMLTGSSICSSNPNTGTISSINYETGVSYQLYDSGDVAVGGPLDSDDAVEGVLTWTGLTAGDGYYVKGTGASPTLCESQSLTVNVASVNNPGKPTVIVAVPASCSSAEITLQVTSPLDVEGVVDYEYNNNDGDWQDEVQFTINAGDGFSIKARIKGGLMCVSEPENCEGEEVAPVARMSATEDTSIKQLPSKTTIKAYPNPFNDQVNFKVLAPEDSKGSLELMNLLGQRVKMVFEGDLKQGENSYNVNLPALQNNTLIYVLTVNGERVTGKLIQSRR
ncbi:T9SS type A sorting domain-containing protein [Mangrovimonas sp. YM274]|uniref:T9SS type A sorting domain-containing protein n=1 Tax=Mangrovimonas sp. YM274 TaxID=3070660 RepID=UPI0027DC3DD4|nr:T9SS type A sorting domain-containing protein [Mangrovimonas sp. YM274]WMI68362.1 T9SS type A sorting domain-containing protein [Mangrovimonas sp. YM274]